MATDMPSSKVISALNFVLALSMATGGAADPSDSDSRPRTPTSVLVADLNGDGVVDRLVGRSGSPPLILLGSHGVSATAIDASTVGLESAVSFNRPTAADLTRDGIIDLLGFDNERLLIFQGLGNARFRRAPAPLVDNIGANPPIGLLIADIMPARGLELLLPRAGDMEGDSIYVGMESETFRSHPFPLPTGGLTRLASSRGVLAADIDRDHDVDLFCATGDLYLQEAGGLVCATASGIREIGTRRSEAAFGDIDADGDLDLFVTKDHTTREDIPVTSHGLLYRNDNGRFVDVSGNIPVEGAAHAGTPMFADFDLDGDLDLFYTRRSGSSGQPLTNAHMLNDGSGGFSSAGDDSWLRRIPPMRETHCYDVDEDGDPDIVGVWCGDGTLATHLNPGDGASAIKIRVLDREGAPHAAGADVELRRGGMIAGYRQTGTSPSHGGWCELIFGAPANGPYELTVTFPSLSNSPVELTDVRPGARITVVEPAGPGALGAFRSRLKVTWRRVIRAAARMGWAGLLPLALVYGGIVGWSISGFATWRGRRRRGLIIVVLLIPVAVAFAATVDWPVYADAKVGGRLALAGLLIGALPGIIAARGVPRHDKRRQSPDQLASIHLKLLDEIDGFSHAAWLKYLGGIASLSRSMTEGADRAQVLLRLRKRLRSYDDVIRPQMVRISDVLARSRFDDELIGTYQRDFGRIDFGVEFVSNTLLREGDDDTLGRQNAATAKALQRLSESAARMHRTIDRIFVLLGRRFRTGVTGETRAAVDRVRSRSEGVEIRDELSDDLPPVFAPQGDLSNILENLIANGVRASAANASRRTPLVRIRSRIQGGQLVVVMTDSGGGIPVDRIEKIFDARVTDPKRRGRGLAYAKRRLKLFDGRIDVVSSSPETGTEVEVTLRTLSEEDR